MSLQATLSKLKTEHKTSNYSDFFFTFSSIFAFFPARAFFNSRSTKRTALPSIRRACSTYCLVLSRDGSTYVTSASTTSPRAKQSSSAAHCAHRRRWTSSDVDCCGSLLLVLDEVPLQPTTLKRESQSLRHLLYYLINQKNSNKKNVSVE